MSRDGCCNVSANPSPKVSPQVQRPTKKMKVVESYVWCTFCGTNLDKSAARVNRKEHWALHHTVQICKEFKAEVDEIDPQKGVDPKAFKRQLEIVDSVLRCLKDYNYTVIPASHFFQNVCVDIPHDEDDIGKKLCFEKFIEESQEAFRKYKIIYLSGMRIPQSFNELLEIPQTTYKDVVWLNHVRPRSNKFAVKTDLSSEEKDKLSQDIMTEFQNIVLAMSK